MNTSSNVATFVSRSGNTVYYGVRNCPFKAKDIKLLESVQRAFTKHIQGMHTYSYADRLSMLKLYSLQRRRDRYTIIYVWKILESIVPNLNIPITCYSSIRRGRLCETSHVGIGHLGTLACIRERAELALELLRHSDGQYLKINPNQNIPSKGCSDFKFFLENL